MLGLLIVGCRKPTVTFRDADAAHLPLDTVSTADPSPVTLPRTEVQGLPSSHVDGVTYKLYVSLPRGYQAGTAQYPVVYLLDADYSFAIARNIAEHLADRNDLPPLLLVGIAYEGPPRYRVHRTRDYTPTHMPTGGYGAEAQQYSGGAPAFQRFLKDELIPFVDQTYRTADERTLVGHSYGGLFGTWVAFTTPDLFDHYLLVSPSLWYDDRTVFALEARFSEAQDSLPASLYFAVGALERNSQRDMPADLRLFTRRIAQRSYRGLTLYTEVLDNETHNSVFPRALSNGLRTLYR